MKNVLIGILVIAVIVLAYLQFKPKTDNNISPASTVLENQTSENISNNANVQPVKPTQPSSPPKSSVVTLDLSTEAARVYKTRLSAALKEKPDFLGVYKSVTIGCGSGCGTVFLVNTTNGKVITLGDQWNQGGKVISGTNIVDFPSEPVQGKVYYADQCDMKAFTGCEYQTYYNDGGAIYSGFNWEQYKIENDQKIVLKAMECKRRVFVENGRNALTYDCTVSQ